LEISFENWKRWDDPEKGSQLRVSKSLLVDYSASAVLILTLVGYPLIAPVSLILEIENRFVSIPFRALVLLLSLIVIIKEVLLRDRFPSGPFWMVWWIFWGLYTSRIVIDGFLNPEVLRIPLAEYLMYAIGMSLLPALALSIRLDESILNRALIWIIVLGALGAIFNVWLITSQQALVTVADFAAGRQKSDTLNPISLSHLGVSVFILSAWVLVCAETHGLMKHTLLIICVLIGVGAAIAGASKGPLLVLAPTLAMIIYMGIKNLHGKNLLHLSVIIVVFLSGLAWLLTNIETVLAFRRMQESLLSDDSRMNLYADAWELFLNNPLLGAGTEPLGYKAHNVILESFMLFGVFSGFLFVTIVVISLIAAVKIFFGYPRNSWISLLYVQLLVGAMFSGELYLSASMWVLIVLAVSQLAVLRSDKCARKRNACDSRWSRSAMNRVS
jgi:hypothetical protein